MGCFRRFSPYSMLASIKGPTKRSTARRSALALLHKRLMPDVRRRHVFRMEIHRRHAT